MQTVSQTEPRTEPRVIPASDAAAQFQRILGEVESGQTVLVTRDGMAVAQIGPVYRHAANAFSGPSKG